MADLESLISRIKKEGQERADSVKTKAEGQAQELISQMAAEMDSYKERALSEASRQADFASERIVEDQKHQARNLVLTAKQETVEKVYAQALEKLNSMSKESFMEYAKEAVLQYEPAGDEIILPKRYGFNDADWINAYLKKQGKKGTVSLYKGDRDVNGGFILVKGGIERNNTFEALLEFYRFDLEGPVLDILFEKGATS